MLAARNIQQPHILLSVRNLDEIYLNQTRCLFRDGKRRNGNYAIEAKLKPFKCIKYEYSGKVSN